jgi:hypothetical protein
MTIKKQARLVAKNCFPKHEINFNKIFSFIIKFHIHNHYSFHNQYSYLKELINRVF